MHVHQGIVYSRVPKAARKVFAGAEILGFLVTVMWFIRKGTGSGKACLLVPLGLSLPEDRQSRLEKNLVKFALSKGPC